jgi:hypothetical protein
MKAEYYSKLARAAVGLGMLGLLAGCSNGPSWGGWSKRPTDAEVAAVLARVEGTRMQAQQPDAPAQPSAVLAASDR